jgi:hypothetical protein
MSEYTNYCAVPANQSQENICQKLAEHKIVSIVDDATAYFPKSQFNWIVVSLSNRENLDKLVDLFDRALMLFVEEDWKTWKLVLRDRKNTYDLRISTGQPINEIIIDQIATFFSLDALELKTLLVPGGQIEFSKKIGLPYLELLDQSLLFRRSQDFTGFSVLAKDL